MGFMEIMMKKGFMNQNKAAGISFNRVSCEATFTGDRTLTTTAPTQKNHTSLTVSVAYKVVSKSIFCCCFASLSRNSSESTSSTAGKASFDV